MKKTMVTTMKMKIESAPAVRSASEVFDPVSIWMEQAFTRKLTPDIDGGFIAEIQEFPGCIAEGDSADEALSNLDKAAAAWIEAQYEQGQSIPAPIERYGYSGKVALRIPRGLHKNASELAAIEGVSLNQFLTTAIAMVAGQKSMIDELRKELINAQKNYYLLSLNANDLKQINTIHKRTYATAIIGDDLHFETASTNIFNHNLMKICHD